jgi:hypothetical protein
VSARRFAGGNTAELRVSVASAPTVIGRDVSATYRL